MSVYEKIKNPETGRYISIFGKTGKRILANFIEAYQYGGDGTTTTTTVGQEKAKTDAPAKIINKWEYLVKSHFHPLSNFISYGQGEIKTNNKIIKIHCAIGKPKITPLDGNKIITVYPASYPIAAKEVNNGEAQPTAVYEVHSVTLKNYIKEILERYKDPKGIKNRIFGLGNVEIDGALLTEIDDNKKRDFKDVYISMVYRPVTKEDHANKTSDVADPPTHKTPKATWKSKKVNQWGGSPVEVYQTTENVYAIVYQYQDPVVRMPCEYATILFKDSINEYRTGGEEVENFDINDVVEYQYTEDGDYNHAFVDNNFRYTRTHGGEAKGDPIISKKESDECRFGYGVTDCCSIMKTALDKSILRPVGDLLPQLYLELKENEDYKNFKSIDEICKITPGNENYEDLFNQRGILEVLTKMGVDADKITLLQKLQGFIDVCRKKVIKWIGGYSLPDSTDLNCESQIEKPDYYPISVFEFIDKTNNTWESRSEIYHLSVSPCLHNGLAGFDSSKNLCELFGLPFLEHSSHVALHSIAHAMDRLYGDHSFTDLGTVEATIRHHNDKETIWENIKKTIEWFANNKPNNRDPVSGMLIQSGEDLWKEANVHDGTKSKSGKIIMYRCRYPHFNEQYGYILDGEKGYKASGECEGIKKAYGCKRGQFLKDDENNIIPVETMTYRNFKSAEERTEEEGVEDQPGERTEEEGVEDQPESKV